MQQPTNEKQSAGEGAISVYLDAEAEEKNVEGLAEGEVSLRRNGSTGNGVQMRIDQQSTGKGVQGRGGHVRPNYLEEDHNNGRRRSRSSN